MDKCNSSDHYIKLTHLIQTNAINNCIIEQSKISKSNSSNHQTDFTHLIPN